MNHREDFLFLIYISLKKHLFPNKCIKTDQRASSVVVADWTRVKSTNYLGEKKSAVNFSKWCRRGAPKLLTQVLIQRETRDL